MMNILHLSDIHYSINDKNFLKNVFEPLMSDIELQSSTYNFDLVLFTGDMIDKAGGDYGVTKSLEKFEEEVIKPILEVLNLPAKRFLFIPGNHDIDRNKVNFFMEDGMRKNLKNANSIESALQYPSNLGLERIADYKKFEENYYNNFLEYKSNDFGYSMILSIDGKKLGVASINNSWRCYDNDDKGHLIVGKTQLDDIDGHLNSENLDLKIALMHHPLEYLIESEHDLTKDYIYRDYDMLFIGHTHLSHAQSITTSVGNGCVICSASSNWEKNTRNVSGMNRNGYNIITYNENEKKMTIYFRQYNYSKNCFIPNLDLGSGETGHAEFAVGDIHSQELFDTYTNSIKFIKDHFIETINENLVSYNTDTIAPKQLKDLFVLPKLKIRDYSEINEFEDYENNIELLSLKDIVEYNHDLIIFGQHESGKTALLYRLVQESIENNYSKCKLPIYIDLKTLMNTNLDRKIASFMGTSIKKTDNILENFETTLFLDNFRFLIENHDIYLQLLKLKEKYPKLKFVGTYNTYALNDIPKEFSSHEISKIVDIATLDYFKSNEIHTLMERWFINNNEVNEDQISQVVSNFHSLNIPSTPLAVSLFLWIYEKQKGFVPRNNAAMVQNFLEKLFEKHSNSDFLSSKFDFHNKDNLLGHIAMEMYKNNSENYSIEESELKTFIADLNTRKKMGLAAHNGSLFKDWVVGYFIEKGIFLSEIKDSTRVIKFKLNCFFQYYLAKAMTFSQDFKKQVLSEEHYLTFQNEIDYYSGLHRYDRDILETMVSRMENNFIEMFLEESQIEFKKILNDVESDTQFDQLFQKGRLFSTNMSKISLAIEDLDEIDREAFLDKHKKTDEIKRAEHDLKLSTTNNFSEKERIINKIPQSQLSPSEILRDSWMLVSKILKNVEDLEDGELKDRAYRSTLICSFVFLYLTVLSAEEQSRIAVAEEENDTKVEFYNFFIRYAVLLHQNLLFSVIGSSKLTPVIFDYLNDQKIKKSDVEVFTSAFLIIDSGEENFETFKTVFNKALKENLSSSMHEFALIKLQMLDVNTNNKKIETYFRDKINYLIKSNTPGAHVINKQNSINENLEKNHKNELISSMKNKKK